MEILIKYSDWLYITRGHHKAIRTGDLVLYKGEVEEVSSADIDEFNGLNHVVTNKMIRIMEACYVNTNVDAIKLNGSIVNTSIERSKIELLEREPKNFLQEVRNAINLATKNNRMFQRPNYVLLHVSKKQELGMLLHEEIGSFTGNMAKIELLGVTLIWSFNIEENEIHCLYDGKSI
jgi:hypothetical protein